MTLHYPLHFRWTAYKQADWCLFFLSSIQVYSFFFAVKCVVWSHGSNCNGVIMTVCIRNNCVWIEKRNFFMVIRWSDPAIVYYATQYSNSYYQHSEVVYFSLYRKQSNIVGFFFKRRNQSHQYRASDNSITEIYNADSWASRNNWPKPQNIASLSLRVEFSVRIQRDT